MVKNHLMYNPKTSSIQSRDHALPCHPRQVSIIQGSIIEVSIIMFMSPTFTNQQYAGKAEVPG